MPEFSTKYQDILAQIDAIDPLVYAKSRNYIDGGVSRLSPFISRGVISTRMVYNRLLERGFKLYQMEKFVQELAWRDFWQRQWQHHGAAINQDLKHPQQNVSFHGLPRAALHAAVCANYERQFGLIFPAPAAKMHRLPRCARRRSKPETAGQARRSYENAYDNA